MLYIAKDADGNEVNIVEIYPEQIESWEKLTGLTLELPPEPEPLDELNPAVMEEALTKMGVELYEES